MRNIFLTLSFFLLGLTLCQAQDWNTLNRTALNLYNQGKYTQAIEAADLAVRAAEDQYGTASEPFISSITNKAYAQFYSGNYQDALSSFLRLSRSSVALYNLPHVVQMQSMVEVSKAYMNLAMYDSSEFYLDVARNIYVNIPKSNRAHYDTAIVEIFDSSLKLQATEASLLHKKGQIDRAIAILQELTSAIRQVYPEDFGDLSDYKTVINNLTTYYNEGMHLDLARKYALEYQALVQDDPDVFNRIYSCQNLGSIYRNLELHDSAEYFWEKGLELVGNSNYRETHIHSVLLNNLGEMYGQLEDYDHSVDVLLRSLRIQESKGSVNPPLYRTTRFNLAEGYHWSGRYAQADSIYNELVGEWIDEIIHNFTYLSDNEKMSFYRNQELFLDHYRSFALEVSGILPLQGTDHPYVDPGVAGKLYDLQIITKAIILNASRKMRKKILNSGDSYLVRSYRQWEDQKYALANALIAGDKSDRELQAQQKIIDDMERILIRYSGNFKSGFHQEKVSWKQVQEKLKPGEAAVEMIRLIDGLIYGALILTPETKDQPVLCLVMSTRSKHLEKQFYQNYYNSIIYRAEDTLSYVTYWQPILDSLKRHMSGEQTPGRIYFSNDGIYNRININTLKNPVTGSYVIDETEIILLTNTREILNSRQPSEFPERRATLVGRPMFSLSMDTLEHSADRSLRDGNFSDLPGTGQEVKLIDELLRRADWETLLLTGADATEEKLRNTHSSRVLHIATHGYFDPGVEGDLNLAEIMIGSGIALTGVNDPLSGGREDGLLSAYEVLGMDLDSTELVVLSACETGKGVNHGEGVYGLQRAISVAGARNMIMSLWKVDDRATQELMTEFYTVWTKKGNLRESFTQAQKNIRKKYHDPYFWGAFILAGE